MPSSDVGATSWKRLAATWTSGSRPTSFSNACQWPWAGLYEPISEATIEPVERHADRRHRGVDEVAIGVRQDAEPPAARPRLLERARNLGEHLPRRERLAERVPLVRRSTEPLEHTCHHVPVRQLRLVALDRRLELVVRRELRVRLVLAEDPRQLATDAAVPVDERAVAVERRPALHAGA